MGHSNAMTVQTTEINSPDTRLPGSWIPAPDQPVFTPRKIRVVCVGAGFSGLLLAHKHKYQFDLSDMVDLTIYEKNHDIGGTWLENKYPGVACDIPAHVYTFPFEPNPSWSSFYAGGDEIWRYIKDTSDKYALQERVQLNSRVIESIWDERVSRWKIKVQQGQHIITDEADVLINGSGILK